MKATQRRIIMSVTNDLVTDQRVHRSCMALVEAGHDVTLVGRLLPGSIPLSRPYKTRRMRLLFNKKAVFYAEYNVRLFLLLLYARADVFYSNDTDTLVANYLAARLRRKPLFFDAHEMFPEVPELVGRPMVKRCWTAIEDWILPRIAHRQEMASVTVCRSIADLYHQRYGLLMGVVRNVPMPVAPDADTARTLLSRLPKDKKILLYQGAVNIGRGIEWFIEAMPLLDECHLVVAGVGDEYQKLIKLASKPPYLGRITFLGRVEPSALRSLTPRASLGLVLLENRGLNYYYSLPNRIGDFVQAGVPLMATDFPEIRAIVARYGVGELLPAPDASSAGQDPSNPEWLASKVRSALREWEETDTKDKKARFDAARNDLNWENDKKTLLKTFNTIFHDNPC